MSRIKYHIFVFLACFCSLAFAQEESVEDADMLSLRLQNRIEQAKLESDRGDYYNALDNLNKAFEIAEKIEDKASQGKIHTKIAKVQFLVNEQDQANISLNKASQIQREISDYSGLAVTYNIKGVIHSTKGEYQDALEYFTASKNLFEQEDLEEYISEVTLNEAKVFIAEKRYEEAKAQLEKTIILAKKYKQDRLLSSALIQNGKVSSALENDDLALSQAQEGHGQHR